MIKKYFIVLISVVFTSCASFLPVENVATDVRVYQLPRETPLKSVNDVIQNEYGFNIVQVDKYNYYYIYKITNFARNELEKQKNKKNHNNSFIYFVFFVYEKYIYLFEYPSEYMLHVHVSDKISPQIMAVEIERLAMQKGSQIQARALASGGEAAAGCRVREDTRVS